MPIRSLMPLAFAAALAASGAALAAQEKSAFTDAEREEVKKLVREYILDNPDIITEAVQILQDREDAEQKAKQQATLKERHKELFDPAEGTVLGNLKGDVTIVEFFDYNCGYCKSVFPSLMDILKEDGNVKLVLKELPILGPASVTASRAALASRKQGKYSAFHRALLSRKGAVNEEGVFDAADEVGLDVKQLKADMKAAEIDKIIADNKSLASDLGVSGTPALLIGEAFVPGAVGKEAMKKMIADARK